MAESTRCRGSPAATVFGFADVHLLLSQLVNGYLCSLLIGDTILNRKLRKNEKFQKNPIFTGHFKPSNFTLRESPYLSKLQ
jgi:hypothetical protein